MNSTAALCSTDNFSNSVTSPSVRNEDGERRDYLDHLFQFDHAVRNNDFSSARMHLLEARIPADQIDAIIARIEQSPSRYGYSAA